MAAVAPRDITEVVGSAKAELERLIDIGKLHNDPLRHPIEAISVGLDAMAALVAELHARPPEMTLTDAQVDTTAKRFAQAGIAYFAGHIRNEFRKGWAYLLAAAAIILAIGIAIGAVMMRGPALTCEDQRGGRVCFVWTLPPAR